MALQLTVASPYDGDIDGYWKIIETNINWLSRGSHVTIACYVNKQARIDGKQPILTRSFDWSGQDDFPFDLELLDQENENVIHMSYEKIKESKLDENGVESNEFVNAVDC
jgi:hypothetical protein